MHEHQKVKKILNNEKKRGKRRGGSGSMIEAIMYCLTIIISLICIFVYKKIEPHNYGLYTWYAIGIMIVATLLFETWRFL